MMLHIRDGYFFCSNFKTDRVSLISFDEVGNLIIKRCAKKDSLAVG